MSDDPNRSVLLAQLRVDFANFMADLRSSSSAILEKMEELHAGQTAVRADLMARMDRLEDRISDIHADIAVNFGAVDHARRVNDNTRDEMRGLSDNVSRMMTLLLRLQTEVTELKGKS